jgi:SAM-dependent methyltransferase
VDDRTRWNEKWRGRHAEGEPPTWWAEHDALLPRTGRALDVACGAGRGALGWARRGLQVSGVDVSDVGLARATARLHAEGHAFTPLRADLSAGALPPGTWDAISVLAYRPEALWPALRSARAPGGVLVVDVLHVLNAERHARPSRRWLAEPGEVLAGLGDLEVLFLDEGWHLDRGVARAIARRS